MRWLRVDWAASWPVNHSPLHRAIGWPVSRVPFGWPVDRYGVGKLTELLPSGPARSNLYYRNLATDNPLLNRTPVSMAET